METSATWQLPDLIKSFMLTASMSLLLGFGLREYYLANQSRVTLGSTRTCMLISLLGFVLFHIQPDGWLYLSGLLVLCVWFGLFYQYKLNQKQTGLLGMLIALMSYTLGPLSLTQPFWFLLLYVITALFILNAKEDIRILTLKMANQEIITLAKFLVLSGVILPLTSKEPLAPFLPVSMHQTWLAVVVISGISYLSYLIQTYFLQGRGVLLTGALGGLYSSTAASIVVARQSKEYPEGQTLAAVAIILATGMMYFRLLVIITLFDFRLGLELVPEFVLLLALAGIMGWQLWRTTRGAESPCQLERPHNPLELAPALFFAISFLVVTALTHYVLGIYPHHGLRWMAFLAGFTDIDPFVLVVVGGQLPSPMPELARAILIATASNNLLKAVYVSVLANGTTRKYASTGLIILAVAAVVAGAFIH